MTAKKSAEITMNDELPGNIEQYVSQTRAELDTALTFEQVLEASGLTEADLTYLGSPYRVVEKSELVNRPFVIRKFTFRFGNMGPYVVVHAVVKDTDEMVIFTDGSTGVHTQLEQIARDRLNREHPYPLEFVLIPNGLRASTYGLNAEGRAAKPDEESVREATTYYLA